MGSWYLMGLEFQFQKLREALETDGGTAMDAFNAASARLKWCIVCCAYYMWFLKIQNP